MATYSYGSWQGSYSFDGNRPPYKIGRVFTFPTISDRSAPGQTGSAAQPCLIASVGIHAQGNSGATPSVRFGVWDSGGGNGYYSATFNLTASATGINSALTTRSLSNPKPVLGNTNYIVGFSKLNTEAVQWDVDTTKSGFIIRDNVSDSGNFTNSANYESGSLLFTITYYTIPLAPTGVVASKGATGVDLVWTAPTDNGGTAITGYRVDRSTDNVNFTNIVANTNSVAASYTDTTAVSGTTYYYRVAAHNLVTTTYGGSYSSPYSSASAAFTYTTATANNATSTLTADVFNPNVTPIVFADDGTGLAFNAVEITYGSEQLYNYVVGQGTATIVAQATDSQTLYGVRSYTVDGLLNTTVDGVSQAAYEVLWKSYLPDLRVSNVSFILNDMSVDDVETLIGNGADKPGVDLDQPVQVVFTPNGVGEAISRLGRVIGVSWAVTLNSVTVSFRLQSAENQVFTLDSEQFGILDKDILG